MDAEPGRSRKILIPESFRPLLWWVKWEELDAWGSRRSIILAAMTNGRLEHLRWIIRSYGVDEIKRVLSECLSTELHAGARHLARVLFGVSQFRHAR